MVTTAKESSNRAGRQKLCSSSKYMGCIFSAGILLLHTSILSEKGLSICPFHRTRNVWNSNLIINGQLWMLPYPPKNGKKAFGIWISVKKRKHNTKKNKSIWIRKQWWVKFIDRNFQIWDWDQKKLYNFYLGKKKCTKVWQSTYNFMFRSSVFH